MGKKNNLGLAQNHNAKQAMAQAPVELRIKEFVVDAINKISGPMSQNLARQQLAANGEVIAAIAAVKKVLAAKGLATEQEFVEARFDVEDDAWGLTPTVEPAVKGDMVRVTYKAKLEASETFGPEARELVRHLGDGQIQPELDTALVGMKTGEEKTVSFTVEGKVLNEATQTLEETKTVYVCQLKVDRVSKYPVAAEAPNA